MTLNIFRKKLKYGKIFKAIIFIAVITIFLFNVKYVSADPITGTANIALGGVGYAVSIVLSLIAYILTAVIGLLITLVVAILIQVAQFSNIINVPTVIQGWVIIRDLCNMFFILILLVIAFATILRIESYNYKKLLPKLLIMAVLINFSRTIFGLLIDFSQVIMLTFVNSFRDGGGWFISVFRTDMLLSINTQTTGDFAVSTWSTAVTIIAGVLAAIITLIVVSVMLAILVMRIIMLWIYTIFSPLIFMGFAVPALQKYTGKIWEDFTKQLIVGPVLAFFIWLALTTASKSADLLGGQSLTSGAKAPEVCVGVGKFFCQGNFQNFIIVIGLLMGGLMMAQQMGGAAGSLAGGALSKIKSAGALVGRAPMALGKFGFFKAGRIADTLQMKGQRGIAKGISRLTGGVFGKEYQAKSLNYRMIAEGWKRNQAVKMRDYEGTKAGAWQDQFNRTLSASFGIPVVSRIMESRAEKKINNLENGVIVNGEVKERGKSQINKEISELKDKKEAAQTDEERAEIQKSIEARQKEITTINTKIAELRKVDWRVGALPKQKYARLEEQQKANEEYTNIGKEDLNEEGLVNKYETESRIDKKRGYLMRLADINGLNTLFASMRKDMTADGIAEFFKKEFGEAAGDVAAETSRRAEAAGNYKLIGFHKFDVTKNRNVIASPEEQEEFAIGRKDKERYAQIHGRTTHFDSLVDRYADGRLGLSNLGTRQLLNIASSEGRMGEIERGNYQTRYGEMVINLKPQIENRITEFRSSGKNIEADGLQKVLDAFVTNYGVLKVQKEQKKGKKKEKKPGGKGEEENDDD